MSKRVTEEAGDASNIKVKKQKKTRSLLKEDVKSSAFKTGSLKVTNGKYAYDGTVVMSEEEARKRDSYTAPLPTRKENKVFVFRDKPEFQPNLSPMEILQAGSFGGTYFRPIHSKVTGLDYDKMWLELPQDWLKGLNVKKCVSRSVYNNDVNKYKVG